MEESEEEKGLPSRKAASCVFLWHFVVKCGVGDCDFLVMRYILQNLLASWKRSKIKGSRHNVAPSYRLLSERGIAHLRVYS
jgi:hypothetical protein